MFIIALFISCSYEILVYLGTSELSLIQSCPCYGGVRPQQSSTVCLTSNLHALFSFVYQDVKCSGNWMWPAKLPGEGATLYDACAAMCDVMASLGIAVDGGKDSLSMAARVGQDTVKSPGSLVISVYAACPDIRATVTPDLKMPEGKGNLLWVKFGDGSKHRMGGSALAQVYNQLGSEAPDLDDAKVRLTTRGIY